MDDRGDDARRASATSADELKPITALFADVVGSTQLGEKLAPDEVKALIGECVSRMAAAVEEFGGVVQAYMGDGICAYFGVPVANEDDPERAARAALRIREAIADYSRDVAAAWGIQDFNVRVGINTGQTAVGLVGASDPQAVALGDTTNTAARLQGAADPGSIAVGESTARRIRDRFTLEDGGSVALKGKAGEVPYWRLVSLGAAAIPDGELPIFGREHELERLTRVAEDLAHGRGQIVTISGDPGIGKTRLLKELRTRCEPTATWLETRCLSYGGELPYWPLVQTIRGWLEVRDGEAEIAVRTKLRARAQPLLGNAAQDVIPYLSRLLGLEPDPRQQELFDGLERAELSRRINNAYATWLEALSASKPVVLAIDDVHWVDPASQAVLSEVLPLTDRASLMVALTIRLDLEGAGRALRMKVLNDFPHRSTDIALAPLAEDAARSFANALVPEVGLDDAARDSIVKLAEGNPLYLEELMTALVQGGQLVRGRTWTLSVRTEDLLPPALESLLIARIDRLPEEARRVAQIAAVVGRVFNVEVLRELAQETAPEADFDTNLAELLRAEIIREVRRFPVLECTFKHGLVQEAAFSSLTPTRRRDLYRRVAAVHERMFAGMLDDKLALLAFYYYRSDDLDKALEYAEKAALQAESTDPAQAAELRGRVERIKAKQAGTAPPDPPSTSVVERIDAPGDPAPEEEAVPLVGTLRAGTKVGPYSVDEFLGEGATGSVYRALDAHGTAVALKILKPELTDDEIFRRRFRHEVRAAGEVQDPHLVGIREAGEAGGVLYIAMDFLDGRSLDELIAAGPLDARATVRVVAHIGTALDALHGAGIIHRDVKPSNIIISNEDGSAVLTDLGLAKGRAYTVLTRPGQVMGTLDYMAPEIIKGEEAGPPSDLYALACIAYECVAGRAPFADRGVFQVGMAHITDEPTDPTEGRTDIPSGIGWAITQALAKDPERRPPSGVAFANLLKMAAKG